MEIPRGQGHQKPKFLRESMGLNWGEGFNQKTFHGRGMDIFGTTHIQC